MNTHRKNKTHGRWTLLLSIVFGCSLSVLATLSMPRAQIIPPVDGGFIAPAVPALPTKDCYVCMYQDFICMQPDTPSVNNCANIQPISSNLVGDDPYSKLGDCELSNGQCVNRFEKYCRDATAAYAAMGYQTAAFPRSYGRFMLPTTTYRSFFAQCKSIQVDYDGHDGPKNCSRYMQTVDLCVVSSPHCSQFSFNNLGCSIFQNMEEALREAESIRSNLPRGVTVSVTGNQAVATDTCLSQLTITIDCDNATPVYQQCATLINYCAKEGETIRCTDDQGAVVQRTCCPGPHSNVWAPGTRCPGYPYRGSCSTLGPGCAMQGKIVSCANDKGVPIDKVCCSTLNNQTGMFNTPAWTTGEQCTQYCSGVGSAFTCAGAATQAQTTGVDPCMNSTAQQACAARGLNLIQGPCYDYSQSNWLSCSVRRVCEWICGNVPWSGGA